MPQGGEKHSGTVITLFGAMGGIGKTIMATNLAVVVAQSGQRVALVDLHLRFGDVALLMEVPNEPNIADLVGAERKVTEESLERCLYRHETGVSVLPCPFPLTEWQRVRAHVGCIETVVTLLAQTYDYVVLDTGSPFDHVMALALKLASTVLFVTTLDQTSLDDSHRVLGMLRLWHFPQDRIKLIVNAINERSSIEPHDIAQALGREVFASVPYDRHISMATKPGTPLVVSHPESRAAQSIIELGGRVTLGRRKGRRTKVMSDQSEEDTFYALKVTDALRRLVELGMSESELLKTTTVFESLVGELTEGKGTDLPDLPSDELINISRKSGSMGEDAIHALQLIQVLRKLLVAGMSERDGLKTTMVLERLVKVWTEEK